MLLLTTGQWENSNATGADIFSDREASYMSHENHFGYAACAALLREQGIAAVPRLAMYAHKEDCGSLLVQINHPQVIRTLLLVADKNKPSLQRVAKYSKNFPHATLAALAELLALKNRLHALVINHRRQKAACTAKSSR